MRFRDIRNMHMDNMRVSFTRKSVTFDGQEHEVTRIRLNRPSEARVRAAAVPEAHAATTRRRRRATAAAPRRRRAAIRLGARRAPRGVRGDPKTLNLLRNLPSLQIFHYNKLNS